MSDSINNSNSNGINNSNNGNGINGNGNGHKFSFKKLFFSKLSHKIFLVFLIIILFFLIGGYIVFKQIDDFINVVEQDLPSNIQDINKTSTLYSLAQYIRYYDEVLTMSARNYAFTGDIKWKDRYNEEVPKLDLVIKTALEEGDERDKELFRAIDEANLALVDLELKALSLTDQGNKEEAVKILESSEYWSYKKTYQNGLIAFVERKGLDYNKVLVVSTNNLQGLRLNLLDSLNFIYKELIVFLIISIFVGIFFGFFIYESISKPLNKIYLATKELEKGNLNVKIDLKSEEDELKKISDTFNKTIEQLRKLEEERKQVDKAKTEFLSITSHELRSPMTPMKAQLEMIIGDYFGPLTKEQRESLMIVLNNTERLDKIIVDFLEISRIEAARLKFDFIKADLTQTIISVVEELKSFMPEKNIKIETKLSPLPIIEADPGRVSQVLRNLINNAIKFTPENGRIEVSVKELNKMILFSVKDNGIGISLEDQKKLFTPFYQVDNMYQHKSGGTGLGLAICKGIVESQNGEIWLESQPGKGTTFHFTVPLTPVREIKPIRILFSEQTNLENKIKLLFIEILGPIGITEFEELNKHKELTKDKLLGYIHNLSKQKIINSEKTAEFINKVNMIYGVKKEESFENSGLKIF